MLLTAGVPPRPHDHWDIVLDTGQVLRFHDPRRFGSVHWTESDPQAHPLLAKLAPEPLSDEFDAEYLYRATRKRAVAIKQLIMNSQVVVGVGNIYASEALVSRTYLAAPRRAPHQPSTGASPDAGHQRRACRSHPDRRHDA